MNDSSLPLRHGVDRLVISGRRVFGWGWLARPEGGVRSVSVRIRGDGWERRVPAGYGLARPDVEETLPDYNGAGSSGFMVTGFIPDGTAREFLLEAELADGTLASFDVGHVAENMHAPGKKTRVMAWLARSVWRRLKRGDIRGIIRRAKAQSYGAQTIDDMNIVEQLLPVLAGSTGVCLMFDHNMGGGANQYRRGMIAQRLAAGQRVLLCTYNLPTLDYRLHLHEPGKEPSVFRASTFLVLDSLIGEAPVRELFVNSPVSFDEPLVLAEWLAKVRAQRPEIRLLVSAHDYFSVCPSFVLLDADGRYCGIPEISQCVSCLKRHEASYVALSPPTEITAWRASWERCLRAADEVRCYSNSTREHLLRAYPGLDPARLTLIPHKVEFLPARTPRVDHSAPLVIGVMGEISVQKGALIVQEITARIEREHPDVRVVVLGTLDVALKSERLRVTGRYQRSELVELIEAHGINMFLFTSIWPETFSYVVAEMIQLGVPIVAFDLGAPAERLRSYRNARLVSEVSAAAALDTLIAFHRQLALEEASAA